jgi:uncharacterized membrane protein YraQ (UPF0718 family)
MVPQQHTTSRAGWPRTLAWIGFGLVTGLAAAWGLASRPAVREWMTVLPDRLSTFTTIFLGIFIEALPFLLLGSIASGLVEVFVDRESLARWIPRRLFPATLAGGLMGVALPVCECGVIPLSRRLMRKGLPVPVGIAFLLAAPVVNPISIASTIAAFGLGPLVFARLGLTLVVAVITGLIFSAAEPASILRPVRLAEAPAAARPPWRQGVRQAMLVGSDDFFDMGRYLVLGSLLAAGMQTLVPQTALTQLSSTPLASVGIMMTLAFVLSICSTVDSFVALAFASSFSIGSVLAFLVFGPMVDIKALTMLSAVFTRRAVIYLVLLPMAMILVAGLAINLVLPG